MEASPGQQVIDYSDPAAVPSPHESNRDVPREEPGEQTPSRAALGEGETASTATPMSLPVDDNEFAAHPKDYGTPTDDTGEVPYPESESETALQHPLDFRPFFTVIEDSTTGEHTQALVHYVFSDDDPDLLTNAALETLPHTLDERPATNDRMAIVDVAADGKTILTTTSLSSEWQAIESNIMQAPSWGNDSGDETRRLMLRISGKELTSSTQERHKSAAEHVHASIKAFDASLVDLDHVLGEHDGNDDDTHVALETR